MRLTHEGFSTLKLVDDDGTTLVIDPHAPIDADLVACSGGPWSERYMGFDGSQSLVAGPDLADVLGGKSTPCEVAGIAFRSANYEPLPGRADALAKARAALKSPAWAASRLRARMKTPDAPPVAWRIAVPNHTIAHLGLSLHRHTTSKVIAHIRALIEGVDLVLAGYPSGEEDAFVEQILSLSPKRLVLFDQVNDLRRTAKLPVETITPTRDRLMELGVETYVLVSGVSMRFEKDDTVKAW